MGMLEYLNEYALIEREGKIRRRSLYLAGREHRGLEKRVASLEEDLGEMALFVRTMFRVLREKGSIDRADFLAAANAIDAQDGTADGKYTGPLDAP